VLLTSLRQGIDRQALVGVGPAAELKGIVSIATPYDAAANKPNDSPIDTVSHAITQLATVGITVNVVVLSAIDAEGLHLVKTSYGEYVFGDPAAMSDRPALWGVKIIVDANMPAATFLVGQSSTASILDREEASIMISFEHSDYFTRNLCAIRGEARVGLAVFVPNAWITGTFPAGSVAQAAPTPANGPKK
jgi:HK97 family phage major capsid protein